MKPSGILTSFIVMLAFMPLSAQTEAMVTLPSTSAGMITDPAAESLDARRYQDTPVSYASGATEIEVPLMSFSCGDLSMALGLSYHTGGIQATQKSGYVGLGWSLTGLPRISRQIVGALDENGIDVRRNSDNRMTNGYAQAIIDGDTDTHYDIYTYDIPGYSGAFYIEPVEQTTPHVFMMPPNGLIVKPAYKNSSAGAYIQSFSIETPDGVEYTFGACDTIASVINDPVTAAGVVEGDKYISSWNVTEIKAKGDQEVINITYADAIPYLTASTTAAWSYSLVFEKDSVAQLQTHRGELSTHKLSHVRSRIPKRISSRTATVDFHTRDYGIGWEPYYSQITFIDRITLSDNEGNEVRRAKFCYVDTVDRVRVDDNFRTRLASLSVHAGDTLLDRRIFSYTGAPPENYRVDVFNNFCRNPLTHSRSTSDESKAPWLMNRSTVGSGAWYLLNRIEDARGCITRFSYATKSCVDASGDTLI